MLHSVHVRKIAFSYDGQYIATTDPRNSEIKLYELITGHEIYTLDKIKTISISLYKNYILIGLWDDNIIQLWDINTNKKIYERRGKNRWFYTVAFSTTGKYFACAGEEGYEIWKVETGENLYFNEKAKTVAYELAFSSDDRYILSANFDHSLRLWDINTGKGITQFLGESELKACAFSPDGDEVWGADTSYPPRIYKFKLMKKK